MSPSQMSKFLIVAALVAYCWSTLAEARAMSQQEALAAATLGQNVGRADQAMLMNAALNNMEQVDSEGDDDDDDDKANLQLQNPLLASGTDIYQDQQQQQQQGNKALMMMDQSYPKYQSVPSGTDLQTQASHHHHGHGAKGWLDMGAWTGKKGSFGWYDKHPVGKGK